MLSHCPIKFHSSFEQSVVCIVWKTNSTICIENPNLIQLTKLWVRYSTSLFVTLSGLQEVVFFQCVVETWRMPQIKWNPVWQVEVNPNYNILKLKRLTSYTLQEELWWCWRLKPTKRNVFVILMRSGVEFEGLRLLSVGLSLAVSLSPSITRCSYFSLC